MYYIYILKSIKDYNIYTGFTADLKIRINQHNDGKVTSTKNRRPLRLIYYEGYISEIDARNREKYLKTGGKAKNDLKLQLEGSLKI